jgi:hypothetical protein
MKTKFRLQCQHEDVDPDLYLDFDTIEQAQEKLIAMNKRYTEITGKEQLEFEFKIFEVIMPDEIESVSAISQ